MTEYIQVRSVKPRRSHKRSEALTMIELPSDSSDDSTSSDDDQRPIVVELPSKTAHKSRKHKSKQALPIIVNTQPVKEKKRRHRAQVQQFLINAQPTVKPTVKKEILIQPVIEPSLNPEIQYVPVESHSRPYRTVLEPALVDQYPIAIYDPLVYPTRRRIITEPADSRTVHLPRHAQKLVNRFLSGMERAHGRRHGYDSDSDCSIDDCHVCRRVRSVMDGRRRSTSVFHRNHHHHHHRDRYILDIEDSPRYCEACNRLRKSDVVVSHAANHSFGHRKRHGRHVHIIETSPSRAVRPIEETKTTTTTTTRPNMVAHPVPAPPAVPHPPSYYPIAYPPYTDPTYGSTYNFDPNMSYYPYGSGANYDYSSYYTQPFYPPNYNHYPVHTTTTSVPTDEVTIEETHTRQRDDRRRQKPNSKTLVIHRSAEEVVPDRKVVVERTHRSRRPRKVHGTTVVRETRTEPIATSTTDLRT